MTDEIVIIDNGMEGSIQTALEAIFPEKKFTGRYLAFYKNPDDPSKEHKSGYLVEFEKGRTKIGSILFKQK